jgi:hypothetical protein
VPIVAAYAEISQLAMDDLEASFNREIYTKGDPYDTAFRCGQREVLERIKRMRSYSGLEVEEEEDNHA